jgi:predicted DNA-binding transcriptional regulator AlpA
MPNSNRTHEPRLLRAIEAARLLGIGRSKLFEMLDRQELPESVWAVASASLVKSLMQWINQTIDAETAARYAFLGAGFTQTKGALLVGANIAARFRHR